MSQNRMEQLIEEMYEYIEGCKPKGFSTTQVIVMKEEIYDILDEMKLKIPEEIKRCAKVVANKDQIIANAEERAEVFQIAQVFSADVVDIGADSVLLETKAKESKNNELIALIKSRFKRINVVRGGAVAIEAISTKSR